MSDAPWNSIFEKYRIDEHDFDEKPFILTAKQIKEATSHYQTTAEREVRILCKQDTRESRPTLFKEKGLFILPIKNGIFALIKGEGYIDIPKIESEPIPYYYSLDFPLETSLVGNSEMQHLDFAYAASLIRTFLGDKSLVLTIRGRKYTPKLSFMVGNQLIETVSVQTEVDAGYEGRNQVVLIEAKNTKTKNTVIRQLYYPFRQWQMYTQKKVNTLFFEKQGSNYSLWEFTFDDINDYNSIRLIKSERFKIILA